MMSRLGMLWSTSCERERDSACARRHADRHAYGHAYRHAYKYAHEDEKCITHLRQEINQEDKNVLIFGVNDVNEYDSGAETDDIQRKIIIDFEIDDEE